MADNTTTSLGQQLRYFRKKLMLSQSEMARHLAISNSLYTKLEANLVNTTSRRLEQFAMRLQTSVEFLTTGKGEEHVEGLPMVSPGTDELRNISLEGLQRLIEMAQDSKLNLLAEQVAPTMNTSTQRALAVIIRTLLLGEKS